MKRSWILWGLSLVVCAAAGFFAGFGYSAKQSASSDEKLVRAHLASKINQVDAAVSALSMLDKGDIQIARQTLEAEITAGVPVLIALREHVDGEQAALASDVIERATKYAQDHGTKLILPAE